LFDATGHPDVPLGPSQIVALHEKWEQAHASLRYIVAETGWAAFDAVTPRWSAEALAAILQPMTSEGAHIVPVMWNGIAGGVDCSGWPLDISDRDHVAELVHTTVAAMASRAADGRGNAASLSVWAARIVHPGAWSILVDAAVDEPALAMELRSSLLNTGGLFSCPGTRAAAVRLAATLSPLLDADEHARLEQVAVALPGGEPDLGRRPYLERARDRILAVLDGTRIQTTAAAARLRQLAEIEVPDAPHASSSAVTAATASPDQWHIWGLDPANLPMAALTAITSAEAALADGSTEQDRWLSLAGAVTAEREFGAEPDLRIQLRHRIGRLITSLIGSQCMRPQDPAGEWTAGLLLALSDDSALKPAPEDTC
jgi:sarcosine oxidase gamma subunit